MSVPSPWVMILLVGGAFRIWRLLAVDTILERPRRWLVRLPRDWNEEEDEVPPTYNEKLAEMIECPWCLGAWISLVVWGLWQVDPHLTEVFASLATVSAAVGLVRENLDSPD